MSKIRTNVKWMGFDSLNGRMLAGDPAALRDMSGMVPPRTTIYISNQPQTSWWRGLRLYIHQPVASQFLIHDLRVGNCSQTVAHGPIPADAFATRMDRLAYVQELFDRDGVITISIEKLGSEMLGAEWTLPKALTATQITFIIENISETPARFLAGFMGEGPDFD